MIVACYHPLPLSACMLNFDLVSILFSTSIPTSFNILVKMFLHFSILRLTKLEDLHELFELRYIVCITETWAFVCWNVLWILRYDIDLAEG